MAKEQNKTPKSKYILINLKIGIYKRKKIKERFGCDRENPRMESNLTL